MFQNQDKINVNRFCDELVRQYPAIAEDVIKMGFGNFTEWFEGDTIRTSECGCLVGSTALCFMKAKKVQVRSDGINSGDDVLYRAICKVTGRKFARYTDELYTCIHKAGISASSMVVDGSYTNATLATYLKARMSRKLKPYRALKAKRSAAAKKAARTRKLNSR